MQQMDEEFAAEAKGKGCRCGGKLHCAHYRRKPRGVPPAAAAAAEKRFSFCCAEEGCRSRTTPRSVRFLGRRVYVGAVVVVVTTMRHGATRKRLSELRRLFGVDASTVLRWRDFWLHLLPATPWWAGERARLMPPVDEAQMPMSLLARMSGTPLEQLVSVLRWLSQSA